MHTTGPVRILLLALLCSAAASAGERPLRIHCVYHAGYGFRALARDYDKRTGIGLRLHLHCRDHFRPSAETLKEGDLYVTTSPASLAQAEKDGLLAAKPLPIGRVVPLIAVRKGNPKNIVSLADLARPDLRVAYPTTCIGKVALALVEKNKLTEAVKPQMTLCHGNRTGVLLPLAVAQVDAAITWSCAIVESGRKDLDLVLIPEEQNVIDPLQIAILKASEDRGRAQAFCDYLATEPAKAILRDSGLAP
jgi:molybdate transport system substrate-binding protein